MSAAVLPHPALIAEFVDPATGLVFVGLDPRPLVTPLHILAAHREWFDAIVRRTWSKPRALDAIFEALPLEENGWDRKTVKAKHIGNHRALYPIWRLERG